MDDADFSSALAGVDARNISAHHRFLGDRLLEGRGVGTRGGRLAEQYIESIFRGNGLEPGADSSYRQAVPMIEMVPAPELGFAASEGTMLSAAYRDDYVLEAGIPQADVQVDAELIFGGFGIEAPEFSWDDFGDLDVTGKILLLRVNDPGTEEDPAFFEGGALTYYGRWTYKFEQAARKGAAGVLLIHTTESAGYGWNVVRTSNTGPQYSLAGEPEFPLQIRGWITEGLARNLLSTAGEDYDALIAASATRGFTARPTGLRVNARVRSEIRDIQTSNVIGILPGTDGSADSEPVVIMAHHDHLGISRGEDGSETIYPGAYDNASGVAVMLGLADALARTGTRFRRPVHFLASTAEESGLLGSEWYTRHPIVPLARTAAVLNVDGANLQGPTSDIAPLGVNRSSLGDDVRAAAAAEQLAVADEQHPEQGMFFRQDHFPFARAGVPSIAFDHGLTYSEKPEGWGESWYRDFVANHYHQPTDAMSEDFDYRGAVQQARVMLRVMAAVATADDLPDWLENSTFERRSG